jgi:hypothetical protein
MTRRHGILVLLTGWSIHLLSAGCLFDRRPVADEMPPGAFDARDVRTPLPEKVASPYGAHLPGPVLNPDRPRPDTLERVQYADPPVIPSNKPSPPQPETPVIALEPPPLQATPPAAPDPEPALVLALRCLLNKNPSEGLALLQQYDRTTQKLLVTLLPFTVRLSEGGLAQASPQEMSLVLEQLNDLMTTLRAHAPLTLKKVCFCRRIHGFGAYEALPLNPSFEAGLDHRPGDRVTIYAEVRNFRSIPKGSVYETHLVKSVEIYPAHNPNGKPIIIQRPDWTQPTISHSPQQDLFLNITFNLPSLPDGQYALRVIVEDRTAFDGEPIVPRAPAQRSLDFQVKRSAGPRAAGGEGAKRRTTE